VAFVDGDHAVNLTGQAERHRVLCGDAGLRAGAAYRGRQCRQPVLWILLGPAAGRMAETAGGVVERTPLPLVVEHAGLDALRADIDADQESHRG
jgi:hypothetical protein